MQQWKEWNSPTSLAFFRPIGSELCRRLDPDKRLYFLFFPFFFKFFLIFILLKSFYWRACARYVEGGGFWKFLRPTVRLLGLCLFWNFRIVMNLKRVRSDKRFMKVMANWARAGGSPLPRQVFLRFWIEKECRERPPENDGWRVVAEERKRKGRKGYGPSRWFVAYACAGGAPLLYN